MQLPLVETFWAVGLLHLPDPLPDIVFPSLREIDVEFSGDLTWLKLLPAIQSPLLSIISVECPERDIMQFMEAFQLTMVTCGMHERLQKFILRKHHREAFDITPQLVACNFSFKNMSSLELLSDCSLHCGTLDLTDDDIDLLTDVMPGLKSLTIGGRPCDIPSKITFKSLDTLSRRCTGLTALQIHFNPDSFITRAADSSSDSGDVGLETPSYDLCSVTNIDVGAIALTGRRSMPCIMVLGLLGVFPRLEKLEYQDSSWIDVDSLIYGFKDASVLHL
jgi:hypothetical protein